MVLCIGLYLIDAVTHMHLRMYACEYVCIFPSSFQSLLAVFRFSSKYHPRNCICIKYTPLITIIHQFQVLLLSKFVILLFQFISYIRQNHRPSSSKNWNMKLSPTAKKLAAIGHISTVPLGRCVRLWGDRIVVQKSDSLSIKRNMI